MQALIIVLLLIPCLFCIGLAGYLCLKGAWGWGWFLFVGFCFGMSAAQVAELLKVL